LAEIEADEIARARSACSELRSPKEPRAYSVVDFIYFSFVTVTTLGYGDIVPNSTLIRLVVVGQIVFGLMLILRATEVRLRR